MDVEITLNYVSGVKKDLELKKKCQLNKNIQKRSKIRKRFNNLKKLKINLKNINFEYKIIFLESGF